VIPGDRTLIDRAKDHQLMNRTWPDEEVGEDS